MYEYDAQCGLFLAKLPERRINEQLRALRARHYTLHTIHCILVHCTEQYTCIV